MSVQEKEPEEETQTWEVPVEQRQTTSVVVEAESMEEAIEKACNKADQDPSIRWESHGTTQEDGLMPYKL